jgi:hypothetical protein
MQNNPEVLKELQRLLFITDLAATKKQSYESIYNLFIYIFKNDLYLLNNHSRLYNVCQKKCSEIYIELKKEDPNRIERPLWKILYKTHEKYIDNYIKILGYVPGNIPLELKRIVASYI